MSNVKIRPLNDSSGLLTCRLPGRRDEGYGHQLMDCMQEQGFYLGFFAYPRKKVQSRIRGASTLI